VWERLAIAIADEWYIDTEWAGEKCEKKGEREMVHSG
jgi:hypothetical protein